MQRIAPQPGPSLASAAPSSGHDRGTPERTGATLLAPTDPLEPHVDEATASRILERNGHLILRNVFDPAAAARLRAEIVAVYDEVTPEMRAGSVTAAIGRMYRYEMFNRSGLCQQAMAHPRILGVIEPLLGRNCHVIACTAWRNPPGPGHDARGQQWHVDGRLHVPHPGTAPWPDHIPYPVYVVSTHIFLDDCAMKDGPTACISGSHRAGCLPPEEREWDLDLTWEGNPSEPHLAHAGDVSFRVSDLWHRRMPVADEASGRFFLQTAYGRREIAQRLRPCEEFNVTTPASRARATDSRLLELIGLHRQGYYDG